MIDSEEGKPALENDNMEVDVECVDERDTPGDKDDDENKESMAMAESGGKVPCEYLQSRAQNIEFVKKLSAEFRDEFNINTSGDPKQGKPASKKQENGKKAQNKESVRRQSQRNKDRYVFSDRDKSLSFNVSSVLPTSESAPCSPQDSASATVIVDESIPSAPASGETAPPVTTPATDLMQLDAVPALTVQSEQPSASTLTSLPIPTDTTVLSGMDHPDDKPASPHGSTIGQTGERSDGDAVTAEAISNASPSCGTSNASEDYALPAFLAVTMEYLRGASAEGVWQDLVTTLVAFEKSGPPSGVRLTFTQLASFR